ncbi:YbfB/YjiJ family MFS transporter [Comamonas sp. w2-DMI]|uniref:YbfB/YjiJ family MFS transporter n=1 Tax=Comamonas sp. w2-DMI TaxID=3126391 RepID=UPI0032E4502F
MPSIAANSFPAPSLNVWRATVAGACASLIGIGLARFAYTPLLPAIIEAHWFSASAATYLGAANLGGYLAGALAAGAMARRVPAIVVLRAMMLLATASFVACAVPLSFLWFFAWRFAAGVSGGALMVLAAPTILPHIPPSRRGFVSGGVFAGIGLGVAASGTLVPLLLQRGLVSTWLGLACVSLLLTLVAWQGWPGPAHAAAEPQPAPQQATPAQAQPTAGLRALYAEYGLNAVGLVPHMIFLVDFVARGLGQGVDAGARYWVLYGLGAVAGPLASGHLADRIGFGRALRMAYGLQIIAVAIPVVSVGSAGLAISSVLVGAFTPGVVPLVLGRVNELLAHQGDAARHAWSRATTSFAVFQALAAYGLSYLFTTRGGDYRMLFAVGASALALALTVDLLAARRRFINGATP